MKLVDFIEHVQGLVPSWMHDLIEVELEGDLVYEAQRMRVVLVVDEDVVEERNAKAYDAGYVDGGTDAMDELEVRNG